MSVKRIEFAPLNEYRYLALCRLMSKHSDLDLLPDSRGVMDVLVFYSAANRDDKLIGMGAQVCCGTVAAKPPSFACAMATPA